MNFDDFCNQEIHKNEKKQNNVEQDIKAEQQNISAEDLIKNYGDLSQEDLLKKLMLEANKEKQNGNLTKEKLDSLSETLTPLLNEQQKKNLTEIIKMLR